MSRLGVWNEVYKNGGDRHMYGDDTTAKMAASFLHNVDTITDLGCGWGGFKNYIKPHQQYIGVDGSNSPHADIIADLETYTTKCEGILLRHVLEHNHNWYKILENVVQSFTKKLIIVLFTPFVVSTQIINSYDNWYGHSMVDIAFNKNDLIKHFVTYDWSLHENIPTNTQYKAEHIFYIEKI